MAEVVTALAPVSYVDSTIRLRWEVSRGEFEQPVDSCIQSPTSYKVRIDGEESDWCLVMYPKGEFNNTERAEKRMTKIYLEASVPSGKTYQTFWQFGIETSHGYWPTNFARKVDVDRKSVSNQYNYRFKGPNSCSDTEFCATDDFAKHFVNSKLTLVTSLVVIVEKDDLVYDFIDNMRSMSALENLSDFTIIAGETRFSCHRVLLAGRSEYFEALFRNEPQKKELVIDKPPELVKALLEFINKGLIPSDIAAIAMDLIHMADMYALNLLTVACENQLVNDLSPDNALETLIVFDKLEHISKRENRDRVIKYIIKEVARIVENPNWISFVQNYPNLITEIFVAKFCARVRCCPFASLD